MQIDIPFTAKGEMVQVVELLVAPGDRVERGESLLAVESDKATFDIPSTRKGVISAINCALGDRVANGTQLIVFDDEPRPTAMASTVQDVSAAPSLLDVRIPYVEPTERATLVEVLVEPGQHVAKGEAIASVQTFKATMDVPSPVAGVVERFPHKVGDALLASDVFAVIRALAGTPVARSTALAGSAANPSERIPGTPKAQHSAVEVQPARQALTRSTQGDPTAQHLTPSQRQQARQAGAQSVQPAFSTAQVSSPSGLSVAPWPRVAFEKFGPVRSTPLSRIKKMAGVNLHRNWVLIPHVTNNDEADITELESLRVQLNLEHEKAGVKFTVLSFVIKSVVCALRKFPAFNASLDGDNVIYKEYVHIGFAADTPNGLVVPVIRDCDKKGLTDIAKELAELSNLARNGKLKPEHMQGGSFSISSLGGIGGSSFTPIINAPEVAILGLSRSTQKPVWDGKQFIPRLMLPLSLSYDHRVIDGAEAARFNACLTSLLADFRRTVL